MGELSFEKSLKRLDEINEKLENGDVTLDESLALFEEGMELSKHCRALISKASQKIEYITAAGIESEAENADGGE